MTFSILFINYNNNKSEKKEQFMVVVPSSGGGVRTERVFVVHNTVTLYKYQRRRYTSRGGGVNMSATGMTSVVFIVITVIILTTMNQTDKRCRSIIGGCEVSEKGENGFVM